MHAALTHDNNVLFAQDGVSPLYAASFKGHSDVVQLLVNAGANVDLFSYMVYGHYTAKLHKAT